MKKKLKTIFIFVFLVIITYFILIYPKDIIDSVLFGINIWMYNVFPALFPFFILSDLMINYGLIELFSELFKKITNLFHLPSNASFIIFSSLISGSPSSAKITKQLLHEELISIDDANHLIRFSHSSSPLFVIGTIGSVLLNDIVLGFLILISLILGNIFIGILFRNKKIIYREKISFKKAFISMHKKRINNNKSFITVISDSIYNAIDILILLLGIIIIFLVFSSIIDKFNLNSNLTIFIKGLLEITQGIKLISIGNFNLFIKTIFITFFLGFGGLSVHLQVASVINGSKIKYKYFMISRIIHAFTSSIIIFVLLKLFNY